MGGRTLTVGSQTGGSLNNFLISLFGFGIDSVATCFSQNKLCVPVGLTLLSALLLLLSCLLRCKFRGENPKGTIIVFYCFLGDLCATVGAILSRELYLQVFMGAFAAALEAVYCIFFCLPMFLCWNSKAERRLRMMKRRRRQNLLAVCVLMVVAGGFVRSEDGNSPTFRPVAGRGLLRVPLQVSSGSPLMDKTEILGYILGLLSLIIACTSRFPALCRARRGHVLTKAYVFSGLLCSLAGALYSAAILLYETQFEFLIRVMPWLLSSVACVALDLFILIIHWCKRGTRHRSIRFSPDTESLLGASGVPAEDNAVIKTQRNQQILSSAQTKMKNVQKMTEMGQYMDVSVRPGRKMCLKEVMLSNGEVEDRLLNRVVRGIRVDSMCSSDTSYDSSEVSSDLEWDFEAAIVQWSEPQAKQLEGDEFPLQEWPTNPQPFNVHTCSTSGLPLKTLSAAEKDDPAESLAE